MSELVQRLKQGPQPVIYSRAKSASELKSAIDRGYVLLKFTETRGGTELGVPLDASACVLRDADFTAARGRIHLEGELTLDYVRVRVLADIDVATLAGEGHLQVVEQAAAVS
jgi:hypothetical protein